MVIYTVLHGERYEGGAIEGVYADLASALASTGFEDPWAAWEWDHDDQYRYNGPGQRPTLVSRRPRLVRWESTIDYIEVTAWEVSG